MEGILGRIMATVLGLIALGGVVLLMATATDSSRISQTGQDLGTLVTNARSQFQQSSTLYTNFTTGNTASLISAGVVPPDMVKNGVIADAWNNQILLAPTGTNNSEMQIILGGNALSVESCTKLITSLTGYVSLTTNGGPNVFSSANPPDSVSANTDCTASTQITAVYQ